MLLQLDTIPMEKKVGSQLKLFYLKLPQEYSPLIYGSRYSRMDQVKFVVESSTEQIAYKWLTSLPL